MIYDPELGARGIMKKKADMGVLHINIISVRHRKKGKK